MPDSRTLILASGSPRRHEILLAAGIAHTVQISPIDESVRLNESPVDYVRRLALEKARATQLRPDTIILAADTTVAMNGEIFGKPSSSEDAVRMLRRLSGRQHWVYTGICLLSETKCISDVAATKVSFLELDDSEIQAYAQSGEPFDKAGGYAIQGLASKFISGIEGCYYNVVGLPVSLVHRQLKTF